MGQRPWGSNRHSGTQEIFSFSWKPMGYCRQLLDHILSRLFLTWPLLHNTSAVSFHLLLLHSCLFISGFPDNTFLCIYLPYFHSLNSSWFHHPNSIWWRFQLTEIRILDFFSIFVLLPLTLSLSRLAKRPYKFYGPVGRKSSCPTMEECRSSTFMF